MYLPLSLRYSTVAEAPTDSLPSTLVLPSIRNCSVLELASELWLLATSNVNAASPTEEIFPATDCASGAAFREAACAGSGLVQAATAKQNTKKLANDNAVRNRMESSIRFRLGIGLRARKQPKRRKVCE